MFIRTSTASSSASALAVPSRTPAWWERHRPSCFVSLGVIFGRVPIPPEARCTFEKLGAVQARTWLATSHFANVNEEFAGHLSDWLAEQETRARWWNSLIIWSTWSLALLAAIIGVLALL
jgi:hypothetical protein